MPTDNGPFGGTVEWIGWKGSWIVAKRRANTTSGVHGWMFLNVETKVIEGPMTDTDRARRCGELGLQNLVLFPAKEAYGLLIGGAVPGSRIECASR